MIEDTARLLDILDRALIPAIQTTINGHVDVSTGVSNSGRVTGSW